MNNKGKDFTSAKGDDNVYTPYSFTKQLLEVEIFNYNKTILEPACGKGAISNILEKYFGVKHTFYDMFTLGDFQQRNFLTEENRKFTYIITNPPYSKLDEFISKAKQVATDKFAFLCKLTHLGGVDRFNKGMFMDENYPLTKIYLFTRQSNLRFFNKKEETKKILKLMNNCVGSSQMIKLEKKLNQINKQIDYPELRGDGKYPAGMYYYVWLVFENMNNIEPFAKYGIQAPILRWIDNNKYILRKKDL